MSASAPATGRRATRVAVDADRAAAYAAATNDANARPGYVSPAFATVVTWDVAADLVTSVVPEHLLPGMVHSAQDMHFHRPLAAGQDLLVSAALLNRRSTPLGPSLCVHIHAVGVDDAAPALDVYSTILLRGAPGGAPDEGPEAPSHALPRELRTSPLLREVATTDPDQPVRYSEASGDRMPIHLDAAAARAVGLPGIVLHGMCTMAMAGQALLASLAGGDAGAVRRWAVRFVRAVQPGRPLVVSAYELPAVASLRRVGYEVAAGGRVVAKDGLLELGPPGGT